MAKGFIRGVLAGTAVSVLAVSALSILAGLPQDMRPAPVDTSQTPGAGPEIGESQPVDQAAAQPEPSPATSPEAEPEPLAEPARPTETAETPPAVAEVTVPAGSGFNAAREDSVASLPAPDVAPDPAPVPGLDAATAPAASALPQADRDTAAQPVTGQDSASLPEPPVAGDAPAAGPAPALPEAGSAPTAAAPAEPAQPPAPDSSPAAVGPSIAVDSTQPDPAQAAADSSPVATGAARSGDGDTVIDVSPRAEAGAVPPQTAALAPQEGARRQPLPVIEPAPPAVRPEQTPPQAPVASDDISPVIRPSIGTPATSLVDRPASGVVTEAPAAATSDMVIPLRRNALPFDATDGRPRLSIILIDRGDSGLGPDALDGFPYPLSIAIDATRPDAAEAARLYRQSGFEVLALVDLLPGSTAQDVEIAIEASLEAVPGAVGVMEGDATGFQHSRAVSDQVAAILGQRGYGLVMLPNGLNTAQKMAARAGVPSATVFRDFDGAGQDASAIRRFLDQGAFRAGQQADGLAGADEAAGEGAGGGVIMIGRLRPDTISAMLLWGLQDRAQRVALTPVSAVLDRPE